MNAARMRALEEGLNGTARKVLAALELGQAFTAQQVIGRMIANGAGKPELHAVQGSLKHLAEIGLAQDEGAGFFMRAEPRNVVRIQKAQGQTQEEEAAPAPTAPTPMERLAAVSARAREIAGQLNALADEADLAAIEVDDHIKRAGKDSASLRQLRELLKGIGGEA